MKITIINEPADAPEHLKGPVTALQEFARFIGINNPDGAVAKYAHGWVAADARFEFRDYVNQFSIIADAVTAFIKLTGGAPRAAVLINTGCSRGEYSLFLSKSETLHDVEGHMKATAQLCVSDYMSKQITK